MKKAVILSLMLILLTYTVSAAIILDNPTRNIYNIGDKFPIAGTVQESTAVSGFLKFSVKCGSNEFPLQLVPVSLNANELKTLKDLNAPQVTISASMNGACVLSSSLVSGNKTYSTAESSTFEITKELDASFSVDEAKIQTGNPLKITGTVLKKDGTGVDGVSELYFKNLGEKYLIDTVEIHKGHFEYTYQTRSNAPGAYTIDVISRDMFGNEYTITDVASFFLSNKLEVRVLSDKSIALPGETIKITGDVRTIQNKAPEDASIEILLDSTKIPVTLKDGNFETDYQLPVNIKSGRHEIVANAKDVIGNTGSDGTRIEITPVATTLTTTLDKASYRPGEALGITTNLYDQGGDIINTLSSVTIVTPEGNNAFSTDLQTNTLEKFQIPNFAMPGKWKIATSMKTLASNAEFVIEEVNNLEASIEGEKLLITNAGNVEYSKRIVATLNNGADTYKAYSSENIMPNQTLAIELNKFAPNGQYTVNLELPQKNVQMNATIVNGKKQLNLNIFFAALVALLVFILLYNALIKLPPIHKYQKESKYSPKMKGVRQKVYNNDEPRSQSSKEDEMHDFRNRILRDIKKTEEQISRPLRQKRGEIGGNTGGNSGFANMFG